MSENMKALPTDWLIKATVDEVQYGVDINFCVWNMKTWEKIYQETGAGEIDLRCIIRDEVHWHDDPDCDLFTFEDFLTECLNI